MNTSKYPHLIQRAIIVLAVLPVLLMLTGCLEQMQSTRIPSGAVTNFFLHLYTGKLDDARVYFAPGLVTPSPELDRSLKDASNRLRRYDIVRQKPATEELADGQCESLKGRVRPRPHRANPLYPDEGGKTRPVTAANERGPLAHLDTS